MGKTSDTDRRMPDAGGKGEEAAAGQGGATNGAQGEAPRAVTGQGRRRQRPARGKGARAAAWKEATGGPGLMRSTTGGASRRAAA